MKRGIVSKPKEVHYFSEDVWRNVLINAKIAGAMSLKEFQKIMKAPVAKLIGSISFLAGCPNPDQIAVLRIIDLLCGIRNSKFFSHRPDQSIRDRLLPGICFPGGDPAVVEFAIDLLEFISLNDHKNDLFKDSLSHHPNPLLKNILLFPTRRNQLLQKLNSANPEIVDRFQSLFPEESIFKMGFWM